MTLMVVVGAFGAFLIVRTLATRTQNTLDRDLAQRSLEMRSSLRDRELSLLESATLAANLEGMADGISSHDAATVARLAESVLALKTELSFLAIVDEAGSPLVGFGRSAAGIRPVSSTRLAEQPVVARALAERTAGKHAGLLANGSDRMLAIAAPVCSVTPRCAPVGAAVVGLRVRDAAAAAVESGTASVSVGLYDEFGALIASAGPIAPDAKVRLGAGVVRRSRSVGGVDVATLTGPFEMQGRRIGSLAVSIPSGPAFAAVREAAIRLGLILLVAMAGVVALGALVSRLIIAQVRPLVDANRALGAGDLAARVPVLADDELGELARGVNAMAEQLQASHESLELRVAQRTAEVQRLLQERTEFFASISHELRTPLAVIIAQAELMRDPTQQKTTRWTADTGATIGDSASQLLSLVNDILDLARAEAGRLVISMADVSLGTVFDTVRPTLEGIAHAGDIDVEIAVERSLRARADAVRLREILINLADNAVKYTPPRGRIRISARRRAALIEFSVSDTGIGIPAEVGDRIFEPFFIVKGSETQQGQASSGLGLALARRLVEAQGGSISYTSDVARGTTFTFTIPAAETQPVRRSRSRS